MRYIRERFHGASPLLRTGGLWALLSLALLAGPPASHADPNPDNDSDALTVRVVPLVDVGVEIDTAAVDLDFTMDMGATEFTLSPATVTILGNVQPQELDLAGANASASPVWALDADESPEIDELRLYALFSVGRSSRPLASEFSGAKNLVTGSPKRAGVLNGSGAGGNFENDQMTGGADMDGLNVGDERQLWLRVDTPPVTSTQDEQSIQLTITATRSQL